MGGSGKWIAYRSNESGRNEIYVQAFPVPGPEGKSRISKDGGVQVRWRQDGKELFYLGPDNQLVLFRSVSIPLVVEWRSA